MANTDICQSEDVLSAAAGGVATTDQKEQLSSGFKKARTKFREIIHIAHGIDDEDGNEKGRTTDVNNEDTADVDFAELLLSSSVLEGLKLSGFKRPSPIQLKAIPVGKMGFDLVVQAKSGTGKTCVFCVIALETVIAQNRYPQVLIVAPTREITTQIYECLRAIGQVLRKQGIRINHYIGGTDVNQDRQSFKGGCQIAVGTPGRLCQLIQLGSLHLNSVRLFVLDEADKLMTENFQKNVNWMFSQLPSSKQMAVFSATYPPTLDELLATYMNSPTMIRLDSTDVQLVGIKQYLTVCPLGQAPTDDDGVYTAISRGAWDNDVFYSKLVRLVEILKLIQYNQCLIFCNYLDKCEQLCTALKSRGFEAQFISANLDQTQRNKVMRQLKHFQCRMLVSTDLTARGIDAQNVNLVINFEVPAEGETYFHRIGRAGRFGGYGAAITICVEGVDDRRFYFMAADNEFRLKALPNVSIADQFPSDLCTNMEYCESLPDLDIRELSKMVHVKNARPGGRRRSRSHSRGKRRIAAEVEFYSPTSNPLTQVKMDKKRVSANEFKMVFPLLDRSDWPISLKLCYTRAQMLDIRDELYPVVDDGESQNGITNGEERLPSMTNGNNIHSEQLEVKRYDKALMLELKDKVPDICFEQQIEAIDIDEVRRFPLDTDTKDGVPKPKDFSRDLTDVMEKMKANFDRGIQAPTLREKPMAAYNPVPQRPSNRNRYYLRGELLQIRQSVNADVWRRYAKSRHNLNEFPFIGASVSGDAKVENATSISPEDKNDTTSSTQQTSAVQRVYSRKELIDMESLVLRRRQRSELESKCNLSQFPFVSNSRLRGKWNESEPLLPADSLSHPPEMPTELLLEPTPRDDRISMADVNLMIQELFIGPKSGLSDQSSTTTEPSVPSPNLQLGVSREERVQTMCNARTYLERSRREFEAKVERNLNGAHSVDVATETDPLEPTISCPVGLNTSLRYSRDAMLVTWKSFVALKLDPTTFPWHQSLVDNELYVERDFFIGEGNESDSGSQSDDECSSREDEESSDAAVSFGDGDGDETTACSKSPDGAHEGVAVRRYYEQLKSWHRQCTLVSANANYQSTMDAYLKTMLSNV